MRKFAATAVLFGLGLGSSAWAADLPVKAPRIVPPPPYNWTGFYIGANVGYSWGKADADFNLPGLATYHLATAFSDSLKPDGVIGGGQIGYNWQVSPAWILGLEADFQGSGQKASSTFSDPFSYFTLQGLPVTGATSFAHEEKLTWFGTARGRIGYAFLPTTMLYATGGLAYGHVSSSLGVSISGTTGGVPFGPIASTLSGSDTRVGWTVGAGIEGALLSSTNWTWKVEYLYIDFGRVTYSFNDPNLGAATISTKIRDNIVRAGLNYRF